jgi:hypothetical protein
MGPHRRDLRAFGEADTGAPKIRDRVHCTCTSRWARSSRLAGTILEAKHTAAFIKLGPSIWASGSAMASPEIGCDAVYGTHVMVHCQSCHTLNRRAHLLVMASHSTNGDVGRSSTAWLVGFQHMAEQ